MASTSAHASINAFNLKEPSSVMRTAHNSIISTFEIKKFSVKNMVTFISASVKNRDGYAKKNIFSNRKKIFFLHTIIAR